MRFIAHLVPSSVWKFKNDNHAPSFVRPSALRQCSYLAHVSRRMSGVHVSCTFTLRPMLRRLITLALLALPSTVTAQYLQNTSTADWSLRTTLSKRSDFLYQYQVQFRNESTFDPNRIYTIPDVSINYLGGMFPNNGRWDTSLGASTVGNVYTGTLLTGLPGTEPMTFRPGWFDGGAPNGTGSRWGSSSTSNSVFDGWGLLGCGIPVLYLGWSGPNHAGSTCASAGYTGWVTLNFELNFPTATPNYTGTELNAQVIGFALTRPAVNVVPEPGTLLLLAGGLLALMASKRRRA